MMHTRRSFLASMAALPFAAQLQPIAVRRRPKAMILVWLDGGMSHIDVFDGKPEASVDVRGDMRWQRLPSGACISEHLPKLGTRLDRCALIRSLTHGEGNHDRASHYLLTGYRPSPVLVYPALGAAIAPLLGDDSPLPHYVAVPTAPAYGHSGFLPRGMGPFETGGDANAAGFRVPDLTPRADAAAIDALVDRLDGLDAPRSADERLHDQYSRRARTMAQDPAVRELFDLQREPAERRQRFGRHRLGQACLLAARLCGGGVPTVLVRDDGWDHHRGVLRALTYGFPGKLTQLDDALSALLDHLRDTGKQDDILVAVLSEFGRTPRLNPQAGRDHWPRAQSVLLSGAGIRGGAVVGSTDAKGEEPHSEACSPADLWATLLAARQLPLDQVLHTDTGRPVRLLPPDASPIAAALRS